MVAKVDRLLSITRKLELQFQADVVVAAPQSVSLGNTHFVSLAVFDHFRFRNGFEDQFMLVALLGVRNLFPYQLAQGVERRIVFVVGRGSGSAKVIEEKGGRVIGMVTDMVIGMDIMVVGTTVVGTLEMAATGTVAGTLMALAPVGVSHPLVGFGFAVTEQ